MQPSAARTPLDSSNQKATTTQKKEGLLAPEILKVLHETIWNVVSNHAYTGVAK